MSDSLIRHEELLQSDLSYAAFYFIWRRHEHTDAIEELARRFPHASTTEINEALKQGVRLDRAVHGDPQKPAPNETEQMNYNEIAALFKKTVPGLSEETYKFAAGLMLQINR